MKRNLAIILVALVIIALIVTIVGLLVRPVGTALHWFFFETILAGGSRLIGNAVTGMLAWGAINYLQAAAVVLGIGLFFGIGLISIKTYLWDKRPGWMGGLKKQTLAILGTATTNEPRDVIITETPAKTKTEEEKVAA